MSERKLKAWQDAGLIDADLARRIRAFEAENARPLGLWATVGLGALTLGLGIVSVVAANWEDIPGAIRLSLHLALIVGLSAFLWGWLPKIAGKRSLSNDALLFILAILGLTFFAHVGQVYQTSSPLWQPLLVWIIIFTPLLLLQGQGWPVAALWLSGVLGTAWNHADEYGHMWNLAAKVSGPEYPTLYWGLIACPPMVVATMAAFIRERDIRPGFWRLLEQLSIAIILGGISIFILLGGWESRPHSILGSVVIQCLAIVAAAGLIAMARRTRSGQASAMILCLAAALHFLQAAILQGNEQRGPWLSAIFFNLLWGVVAAGALHARWRHIFQGAIAVLALRIIILSFELNDDLLANGFGLILSGAFAMFVAWLTVKISKRYAPKREPQA